MKMFSMYVKTIISNKNDDILLLKERRMDKKPRWDLPGTILTDNESFDEAVINNVQKEIGYYVYPGKIVGITHFADHDIKEIHVVMTGTILSGEPVLSENYEDFKWIPLERITDYPLKNWLNNYIKHGDEPFHDVTREIEKLESLEDARREVSNDNFFNSPKTSEPQHEPHVVEVSEDNKSSFDILKDTIKRTFHPRKAETATTQPKTNLFSSNEDSTKPKSSIDEKLNISRTKEEEIIPESNIEDIIPVDEELLAKIKSGAGDEIIVEHDGKTNLADNDSLVKPAVQTEPAVETKIDAPVTEDIASQNLDSDPTKTNPEDKYKVIRKKDVSGKGNTFVGSITRTAITAEKEEPEEDNPTKKEEPKNAIFNTNVNHENNMKKDVVKRKITTPPKVDEKQDIKVIHNNEKTPYIRKEKESKQNISFNSEGIKRRGWKEKIDEFNRTDASKQRRNIPRPKGQRKD